MEHDPGKLTTEQPVKVKTYVVQNIIFVVLASPFFYVGIQLLGFLQTQNHGRLLLVKFGLPALLFLVGGIALAILTARRIRRLARSKGDAYAATKARRYRGWFVRLSVLTIIAGVFLAISLPGTLSYAKHAYDSAAEIDLRRLQELQVAYNQQNGRFARELSELPQWHGNPAVVTEIVTAEQKCWKARAAHDKSPNIVYFDSCGEDQGELVFTRLPRR